MHLLFCQGSPYPRQDQNAIDAVMQFAINKLGFQPEDIILFGWSIGGYSSLVAAAQYPDIKGVVRKLISTERTKRMLTKFQLFRFLMPLSMMSFN